MSVLISRCRLGDYALRLLAGRSISTSEFSEGGLFIVCIYGRMSSRRGVHVRKDEEGEEEEEE